MKQKIALVIIDTYTDKRLPKFAIDKSLEFGKISKIYTFSKNNFYPGSEFFKIDDISNAGQYSHIVLEVLPEIIVEDYFLIIQWDGFPVNKEMWTDDFLSYDYIGAPISLSKTERYVGNGGFSLRSNKLLRELKKQKIKSNFPGDSEDQIICLKFKEMLLSNGIKFAPVDVAENFSYETGNFTKPAFGFHSPINFPAFLSERELMGYSDDIIGRIAREEILLGYLASCLRFGMRDLFSQSVKDYEMKPNLVKAIDFEAKNNPNSGFKEFIRQFS